MRIDFDAPVDLAQYSAFDGEAVALDLLEIVTPEGGSEPFYRFSLIRSDRTYVGGDEYRGAVFGVNAAAPSEEDAKADVLAAIMAAGGR